MNDIRALQISRLESENADLRAENERLALTVASLSDAISAMERIARMMRATGLDRPEAVPDLPYPDVGTGDLPSEES